MYAPKIAMLSRTGISAGRFLCSVLVATDAPDARPGRHGLEVHLTRNFAKIRGEPDQPYRSAAQAIAHVGEMFHLAEEELKKRGL